MILQHTLVSDTPMQIQRFFNLTRIKLVLFSVLLVLGLPIAKADTNRMLIVTDIAPIHSLVSMIVGQQADVKLLVPANQSPHSFSLKPSQVRIINRAALIVTLSDKFTPTLGRHLKSISNNAVVLQLSDTIISQQAGNQQAHNQMTRTKSEYQSFEHSNGKNNNENSEANFNLTNEHAEHIIDPHTWLNPKNAIIWLEHIAASVIELDNHNLSLYMQNTNQAKDELIRMHESFKKQLSAVRAHQYIVYHDAYQHFANSYGLQKPIAIALSDARAPGARKLHAIREQARTTKCVFSELLHDDIIVDTVTAGLPVKRATLDPMGSKLAIGPKHYPDTMRALVNNFVACLS